MQIHKFEAIPQGVEIEIPSNAEIIHVAEQHGTVMFWAKIDAAKEKVRRTFVIVGTGHEFDDKLVRYWGTAMLDGFVWHLMEIKH